MRKGLWVALVLFIAMPVCYITAYTILEEYREKAVPITLGFLVICIIILVQMSKKKK